MPTRNRNPVAFGLKLNHQHLLQNKILLSSVLDLNSNTRFYPVKLMEGAAFDQKKGKNNHIRSKDNHIRVYQRLKLAQYTVFDSGQWQMASKEHQNRHAHDDTSPEHFSTSH